MTDTPASEATAPAPKKASSIWTDLGPVLLFVLVYNLGQRHILGDIPAPTDADKLAASTQAMYWATGDLHGCDP